MRIVLDKLISQPVLHSHFDLGNDMVKVVGASFAFQQATTISTTTGALNLTSTDGAINVTLGGGAADDFIVDTDTFVVESDNNRVGIGTASPDVMLHLFTSDSTIAPPAGTALFIEASTGDRFISFENPGGYKAGFYFGDAGSSTVGELYYNHDGDKFVFQTATADSAFLSGGATPTLAFQGAATISTPINTDLTLSNSGTGDIILSPGGNVGIGTTSPNAPLEVIAWQLIDRNLGETNDATALRITADNGDTNAAYLDIRPRYTTSEGDRRVMLDVRDHGGTSRALVLQSLGGNTGIGTTTPTAVLHLKAGTATAGTAPLKFTSGVLNTTAEAGAMEFLTDDFYLTITTGAARKKILLGNGVNFGPGAVASITVVDGQITAIS